MRLARESVGFFRSLGPELFEPVGYLFLATTEDGLDELERRREVQASLGVPVERVDAARVDGLMTDDVLGAVFCGEDGTADPAGITRELVRRASELGVEVREETDALELDADVLVLATGRGVRSARGEARSRASGPAARPPARRDRGGRRPRPRSPADDRVGVRLPLPPPRRRARARDAGADAALG